MSKGARTAKIKAGTPSSAQKQLAPPISTNGFLGEFPNLIGLPADQLDEAIQKILPTQPIHYHQLTDGINLLNGLLGQPLPMVDAHFALLIRGELIVGLVCVNLNDELPGEQVPDHLQADDLDSRYLMSRALEAGATQLLLVSTLNGRQHVLETEELAFIDALGQTLELVDLELIDWLLLTDEQTISWLTDQIDTPQNPLIDESADTLDADTANSTQATNQSRPVVESAINLTLGVWESNDRLSEVELIYWALDASKDTYKRTMLDEDSDEEDVDEADWHFSKLQELQNGLFALVTGLASNLAKTATGMRR